MRPNSKVSGHEPSSDKKDDIRRGLQAMLGALRGLQQALQELQEWEEGAC